ncbi:transcription factor Adf-1-like isoform X1 [Eurosta solidaginis]|uniref:transcription factor Adf-1-like isoform X1 n=1 Tax=Eurosta solidaginis TaxID=178769 RepID=UPI0035307B70
MDGIHDTNFNVRLVKTIKKFPILYNPEHKDYTNREARETAWIEIGDELSCDPKALKKKWKNFRTIFARKLREMKYGMKESKQQHYLFNYMTFLIPYLKKNYDPPASIKGSNLNNILADAAVDDENEMHSNYYTEEDNITQESEDPIYYEEDDDTKSMNTSLQKTKRSYNSEEGDEEQNDTGLNKSMDTWHQKIKTSYDSEEEDEEQNDTGLNKSMDTSHQKIKRSYDLEVEYEVQNDTGLNNAVNHKRTKRSEFEDASNPKKHFLLSLLPDLDEMTNSQMRQFKMKVIVLVEDILKDAST